MGLCGVQYHLHFQLSFPTVHPCILHTTEVCGSICHCIVEAGVAWEVMGVCLCPTHTSIIVTLHAFFPLADVIEESIRENEQGCPTDAPTTGPGDSQVEQGATCETDAQTTLQEVHIHVYCMFVYSHTLTHKWCALCANCGSLTK